MIKVIKDANSKKSNLRRKVKRLSAFKIH